MPAAISSDPEYIVRIMLSVGIDGNRHRTRRKIAEHRIHGRLEGSSFPEVNSVPEYSNFGQHGDLVEKSAIRRAAAVIDHHDCSHCASDEPPHQ